MRIAATADLHFSAARHNALHEQLNHVRDEADVLVLAGDLTNYGKPDEMEPLLNVIVRSRIPTIAVLGNHDYENGKQAELDFEIEDSIELRLVEYEPVQLERTCAETFGQLRHGIVSEKKSAVSGYFT